jgi:hypothetical protein
MKVPRKSLQKNGGSKIDEAETFHCEKSGS